MGTTKVNAPNRAYTGHVGGVAFVDGVGEVDLDARPALREYFDRHGYTYGSDEPAAAAIPVDEKPVKSLNLAELKARVVKVRGEGAIPPGNPTRANLIAILDSATPGAGPTGNQDNERHDQADPTSTGIVTAESTANNGIGVVEGEQVPGPTADEQAKADAETAAAAQEKADHDASAAKADDAPKS